MMSKNWKTTIFWWWKSRSWKCHWKL